MHLEIAKESYKKGQKKIQKGFIIHQ